MNSMTPHYLKNLFNGWTMDDLIWQRDMLNRFSGQDREKLDVADEIKRREDEHGQTSELPRSG